MKFTCHQLRLSLVSLFLATGVHRNRHCIGIYTYSIGNTPASNHLYHHTCFQLRCSTALIRANDTEKLALMFKLMDYIGQVQEEDPERGNQIKSPDTSSEDDASPGIVQMLSHMHEFIVQQGLADMRANADTITQDCEKYVEALLELFNRFSNLVEEAANNDPRFLSTRDKAFEEIVNNCRFV